MFLRQAAGLASQDSAQAQLEKLDVMARESGIENQDTVALLADLLSIRGEHRDPPLTVSSEKRKDMTLEALVHIYKGSPIAAPCCSLWKMPIGWIPRRWTS